MEQLSSLSNLKEFVKKQRGFGKSIPVAPTEDLASYPKMLDSDLQKLQSVNASAVYLPRMEDVYPDGLARRD